jgi:hypothetical protein
MPAVGPTCDGERTARIVRVFQAGAKLTLAACFSGALNRADHSPARRRRLGATREQLAHVHPTLLVHAARHLRRVSCPLRGGGF